MDELPIPDYSLIDLNKYRPHPPHGLSKPWLPMITSRGCPYRCNFCSKPVFGSKYRATNAAYVVEQLQILKSQYGVREVAFYDDVFTLNKERAFNICELMLEADLNLSWSCESRVDLVDPKLLAAMKRSGCFLVAYGIESGSPTVLKTLNKGTTLKQAEAAVAATRQADMQTTGYFMLGNPGETMEDIKQTIDFAIKLKLDYAQFAVTVPLPGSQLYEQYIATHEDKVDWEAFSYASLGRATVPLFANDRLSAADIQRAVGQATRRFYLRPEYIVQRGKGALSSWANFKLLAGGVKLYVENMLGK